MKFTFLTSLILLVLLFSATLFLADAGRPEPQKGGVNDDFGFTGPGGGFNIPGFGPALGGGYGSGYWGPYGRRSKNGVVRTSVVCKEKGPCYKKKLRCPGKCFSSYSHAGKGYGYGGGGGGGGCTVDCSKDCRAFC